MKLVTFYYASGNKRLKTNVGTDGGLTVERLTVERLAVSTRVIMFQLLILIMVQSQRVAYSASKARLYIMLIS